MRTMLKIVTLMMLTQVPATPAGAMTVAHADLRVQPADQRSDYLYLSMHNVQPGERQKLIAVLNGHCNGTSTEVDRTLVSVVDAAALVLRVNIRDYGWSKAVIKKLADPRFTTLVEESVERGVMVVPWEGGVWPGDGKVYKAGSFRYEKPVRKVVRRANGVAPWLTEGASAAAAAEMVEWGGDFFPMVSALWFLNETAIQEGRTVGYYDLLGIKTQKDFERIVRFDQKLAKDLEHRRVVVFSGITLQPRRIEITRSVLGPLWRTFDNETAVDDRNPIRTLDDELRFDATEQIAPLPNGLPGFYLGDAAGKAQNKAPDQVVGGDRTGHGNDTRLHANISCIRCHNLQKGENFIKDIDFSKLSRLKSADYDKLRELKRLYTRDIAPDIEVARRSFGKTILETTGLQAHEYATAYETFFSRVEDARVDAAYAALDMGMESKELMRRLRAYDQVQDIDPVLSIIMNGGIVPIRQWEEVIHLAHAAVRSVP